MALWNPITFEPQNFENKIFVSRFIRRTESQKSIRIRLLKTITLNYLFILNNKGGRFDDGLVDDVKTLKKIVILFSIMIPYWLVYVQVSYSYRFSQILLKTYSFEYLNRLKQCL